MDEKEYKNVSKWLHEMSKDAIKKTLDSGLPVTFVENNKISRKYPNGKKEVIKEIGNWKIKPEKKVYRIEGGE